MKKAIIFGSNGQDGFYLKKLLNSLDVQVLAVSRTDGWIKGDICDFEVCLRASVGVSTVFHNVAQVPLANNSKVFKEVNIGGTRNICEASKRNGVKNFVYTSSSAVYGMPSKLPVLIDDPKIPVEDYGRAKLEGEVICKDLTNYGIQVKIVRPRTILGLGRLGIFGILFGWVSSGTNIYTLGKGDGPYQFIHAEDLANGITRAAKLDGNFEFNLGALDYGTFRDDLQTLCNYSKSGSQVVGLND